MISKHLDGLCWRWRSGAAQFGRCRPAEQPTYIAGSIGGRCSALQVLLINVTMGLLWHGTPDFGGIAAIQVQLYVAL